ISLCQSSGEFTTLRAAKRDKARIAENSFSDSHHFAVYSVLFYTLHGLEMELEGELNNSRRVYGFHCRAESWTVQHPDWDSEICPVQNIEKLCPELQAPSLGESETFIYRQIPVLEAVRPNRVSPHRAVGADGYERRKAHSRLDRNP